jgi:hypothetical protein
MMRTCVVVLVLAALTGCKSAYYGFWEKMGWEKRHLLVDDIKEAQDDQNKAKEQFKSALEKFQELTKFEGGELEAKYKKLDKEYKACESRAEDVRDQIKAVDKVAQDLFKEWSGEIEKYDNPDYKRTSEQKLRDTRVRYDQMYASMKTAESKMDPVLRKFNDQVMFLKHNLNAQAISSIQGTVKGIESDVTALIKDMETSIKEADAFIAQMK